MHAFAAHDYLCFAASTLLAGGAFLEWARRRDCSHRVLCSVAWLGALLILVSAPVIDHVGRVPRERLRASIDGVAPTYAREVERLGHANLPDRPSPDDPTYVAILDAEKRWLDANHRIADIYTARRAPDGSVRLLVDSETDYDHDGRYVGEREARTTPGEDYGSDTASLAPVFAGRSTFDDVPFHDRWGWWVSAAVPLRAPDGRVEAVLGVDFPAAEWLRATRDARRAAMVVMALLVVLVLACGVIIGLLEGDIARRVAAEAALVAARDAAEAASRAKDRFLATMSHEIRTPMNGILGMAGLLLDTPLRSDQREYAGGVVRSAEALLGVLNDILDYSKIEADKLTMETVPFDLRATFEDALATVVSRAEEKGLDLALRYPPQSAARFLGDPGRLRQVVLNLVSNAIKFTAEGHVLVDVRIAAVGAERAGVRVEVRDTGIGISREQQSRLFQEFSQADSSTTRLYGGTGLGLVICKRIVERMGGTVGVVSEVGRGSTFSFNVELPTLQVDAGVVHGSALDGAHVLVLGTAPSATVVLPELLSAAGARVTVAVNLDEARRALETSTSPSLIVVELAVARPDPTASLREMRAVTGWEASAALIASHALRGDDTMPAGYGAVLACPLRARDVVDRLAALQHKVLVIPTTEWRAQSHPPRISDRSPTVRWRVLLAEDNAVNQKVAVRLLERLRCEVDVAADGEEAVTKALTGAHDMVFMDCHMPRLDGYSATRQLRESGGAGRRLPIVALTASVLDSERAACIAAGMNDVIHKPVRVAELHAMLERYGTRVQRPSLAP